MDWLQKYIFPAEAKTVSPEFVRVGTRLAALEMIESGTTDLRRHVLLRGGDRDGRRTRPGCAACWARRSSSFPVADAKTPAEALARAERFIKEFKDDGLIVPARRAARALHARQARRCWRAAALARKYGVPILIHVAETEDEIEDRARRSTR